MKKVLIGERFGRWTVVKLDGYDKSGKNTMFLCKCDCGKTRRVLRNSLLRGLSKSCGCLCKEIQSELHNGKSFVVKHNLSNSRIYHIWASMKGRCYNNNDNAYKDYGARGITVCDEWKNDFMSFYNWAMNNGYHDDLTIDRIDVNGDYKPSNCRWATFKEQQNNRRNNNYVTIGNVTKTFSDWCETYGINRRTAYRRLEYGWSLDKSLTTPVHKKKTS